MRLSSILGHSADLLHIIRKSHQPSDLIMSDYFRKKKYIGSSERRFLSELVFSVLRGYYLIDYCVKMSLTKSGINLPEEKSEYLIMISAAGIYFFEVLENEHLIFHPSEIAKKFMSQDSTDFIHNLFAALSEKINMDINETGIIFNHFQKIFNEIDSKIVTIRTSNWNLSEDEKKTISIRYSVPGWIIERWYKNKFINYNIDEICNLSESLLYPAPLTIRVNQTYKSRQQITEYFRKNDIEFENCKFSPSGIILRKRIQLNTLEIFKKGLIEVQDEGSQLISFALAPEPDERILDACAGAGGKSLHIADIMKNSGEIFSNDNDIRKLKELKFRAKRCGFDSISTINLSNLSETKQSNKQKSRLEFDRVLVDAPCSGMGTVRRMPMQKWRLTPEILKKHGKKQLEILEYYSQFVIDGGFLVYSTCSLMAEENEEVVEQFLSRNNNFKPFPIKPALNNFNIIIEGLENEDYMLRLSPYKHGCDGFFIAKFIKEEQFEQF